MLTTWYAVISDKDSIDWGDGSFNYDEAKKMAEETGAYSLLTINGEWLDEESDCLIDPICEKEEITPWAKTEEESWEGEGWYTFREWIKTDGIYSVYDFASPQMPEITYIENLDQFRENLVYDWERETIVESFGLGFCKDCKFCNVSDGHYECISCEYEERYRYCSCEDYCSCEEYGSCPAFQEKQ